LKQRFAVEIGFGDGLAEGVVVADDVVNDEEEVMGY